MSNWQVNKDLLDEIIELINTLSTNNLIIVLGKIYEIRVSEKILENQKFMNMNIGIASENIFSIKKNIGIGKQNKEIDNE